MGTILTAFDANDFEIKEIRSRNLSEWAVGELYAHHKGKDYWPRILEAMVRGPVIAIDFGNQRLDEQRALALKLREQLKPDCSNPALNLIHSSDPEYHWGEHEILLRTEGF